MGTHRLARDGALALRDPVDERLVACGGRDVGALILGLPVLWIRTAISVSAESAAIIR